MISLHQIVNALVDNDAMEAIEYPSVASPQWMFRGGAVYGLANVMLDVTILIYERE